MIDAIQSLVQSVHKITDTGLRKEILGKVTAVQGTVAETNAHLRARQDELDSLRAQLSIQESVHAEPASEFYDPPV